MGVSIETLLPGDGVVSLTYYFTCYARGRFLGPEVSLCGFP